MDIDITLPLLKMALTTPSAQMEYDFERLETYGDSFLKLHLTLHLYVKFPNKNEGALTILRTALENNSNFFQKSKEQGFLYILFVIRSPE